VVAGSAKKSVRFSEVVHRQVFRSNSSILGQKLKNTKKAEQVPRCFEAPFLAWNYVLNFTLKSLHMYT
jgi:hypothetical protein